MNRTDASLEAALGHAVDLYRMAAFRLDTPYSYSKFRNIKHLARRTRARTFIEAGTFRGVTAARCAAVFDRVVTVELDEKLAAEARTYLSRWPNVECHQGDALELIPQIVQRPDIDDTLIFLDGHFSAGETALGSFSEPAIEEIVALGSHRHKIRGMIIDDFRGFGVFDGWPAKSSLFAALEEHFPGFEASVHLDQVLVARVRDTDAAPPPRR